MRGRLRLPEHRKVCSEFAFSKISSVLIWAEGALLDALSVAVKRQLFLVSADPGTATSLWDTAEAAALLQLAFLETTKWNPQGAPSRKTQNDTPTDQNPLCRTHACYAPWGFQNIFWGFQNRCLNVVPLTSPSSFPAHLLWGRLGQREPGPVVPLRVLTQLMSLSYLCEESCLELRQKP